MAEKSELKLMSEITDRIGKLSSAGKSLLGESLESAVLVPDIRLIEQVVERYALLTPTGKDYVNKTLGTDRPATN